MSDDSRTPDESLPDTTAHSDGSLYDALGLRDSGARILGVLIRLDARLQALSTRQEEILSELAKQDQRLDKWQTAAEIVSAAGSALVKGAQSRVLWLLIGVALGIGALSIDAIGQAAAPILLGGSSNAP